MISADPSLEPRVAIACAIAKWRPLALRVHLLLLILLTLVPLAVLIGDNIWKRRAAELRNAGTTALTLAKVVAERQQDLLTDAEYLLRSLGDVPEVRSALPGSCARILQSSVNRRPWINVIGLYRPDGSPACANIPSTVTLGDRGYFRQALARRELTFSGFIMSRFMNRPIMVVALPLLDPAGEVKGVLTTGIPLEAFVQINDTELANLDGALLMVDSTGTVLTRKPDPEPYAGKSFTDHPLVQALLQHEEGTLEQKGLDGSLRIFGFTTLAGAGAKIAIGLNQASVLTEINSEALEDASMVVVLFVLTLGLAWWIAERSVAGPIDAICRTTQRLAAGRFDARTGRISGAREIHELAAAIDETATSLEERDQAVILAADRIAAGGASLRAVFESSTDALFLDRVEADGVFVTEIANPAGLAKIGLEAGRVISGPIASYLPPPVAQRVTDWFRRCILHGDKLHFVEHLPVDGEMRELEVTLVPLTDKDGTVTHIYSNIRDVTERRRLEAEVRRQAGMLATLVAWIPDGVQMLSPDLRLIAWNDRLWRILELNGSEILAAPDPGMTLMRRMAATGAYGDGAIDDLVEEYRATTASQQAVLCRRQLVSGQWIERRGTPLPDGSYVEIIRDVTKEVAREAQMRDSCERMEKQAVELAAKAEQLDAARLTAERADRAKSEFLAAMSHELRTPLTGIIGFSEMLLERSFPDADRRQYLTLMHDAGQTLLAIINDVLDWSKIESGRLDIESIPFDLRAVVASCVGLSEIMARDKGLTLTLDLTEAPVGPVRGDANRVRQVLSNLLGNAVKFTKAGTVSLRIRKVEAGRGSVIEDQYRVEVSDTGIGIAADKRDRIFQRFSQADASISRRFGGSGLGLAITKSLVRLMGGVIGFESAVGKGSTFWFELPFEQAGLPDAVGLEPTPISGSRRILLAEDILMNQLLVSTVLRQHGHDVTVVENGLKAVEAALSGGFDLVLMDIQMPVLDGIAATRAIRKAEQPGCRLPIVALTASTSLSDMTRCQDAGMDGHVEKPIDRVALLDVIDRLTAKRDLLESTITALNAAVFKSDGPTVIRNEADVLDEAVLADLRETLGAAMVAKLLEAYRLGASARIAELTARNAPTATVADAAHAMVSLAGNIGLTELTGLCRELCSAVRNGRDHEDLLRRVLESADRAEAALKRQDGKVA